MDYECLAILGNENNYRSRIMPEEYKNLEQQRKNEENREHVEYTEYQDAPYRLDHQVLRRMQKMELALNYILAHSNDPECTIDTVAEVAGYEAAYFKRLFPQYFEMPFERFVTKVRLREAARYLQEHNFPRQPYRVFHYDNSQSFSKAFRREIGASPRIFFDENYEVPDMPMRKRVEGVPIRLEYTQMGAMQIEAKSLRPKWGNDTYLLDAAALPFRGTKAGKTMKEKPEEEWFGFWWFTSDWELLYLYGTIHENFASVTIEETPERSSETTQKQASEAGPEKDSKAEESKTDDISHVLIHGGNYCLFSCPRPEKEQEIALHMRILSRFVLKEWVPLNRKKVDSMGVTFEKYTKDRIYFCLPLLTGMVGSEGLQKKKWDVAEWAKRIDEHITQDLRIEALAHSAGYSPHHYREVFQMYYGISPSVYILRRRLYLATVELKKDLDSWRSILKRYGFPSWERYEQQFIEEFGDKPLLHNVREIRLTDLIDYYEKNRELVRVSYRKMNEQKVLLHEIRRTEEEMPEDINGIVLYWFTHEFEGFEAFRDLTGSSEKNKKRIFIWDDQPVSSAEGEDIYRYYVGTVLKNDVDLQEIRRRIKSRTIRLETIPGGRYAVFSTLEKTDLYAMDEAYRMLTRCAFGGWINEHRYRADLSRRTFVIWRRNKLNFYVPIID